MNAQFKIRTSPIVFLCAIACLVPLSASAQNSPPPPPLPQLDVPPVSPGAVQPRDFNNEPVPAAPAQGSNDGLQPVNPDDVESEVLTRGPVHEAFAENYVADPQAGPVVNKQPPNLIEEIPPEDQPEGNNVEFVPGYWAFDEDLDDFIWVSGLWRDLPPGQRWVPGYWNEVDGGFQWIPGFWIGAETAELNYLPQPPASLDQGPNIQSPSANHFWVPGCWVYQANNYSWRPGYWSQPYNDYLWMPARYQWTPRGYVYCNGYWDYPLVRRGLLFSPVRFWNRRYAYNYYGYRYQPRLAVGVGPLLIHFFIGPRYRNYYFGNYYGPNYLARGIYPFTGINNYFGNRYYYDPIRTYYQRAPYRNTFDRLVGWHNYFDRNADLRPPTTFSRTREFVTANSGGRNSSVVRQAVLGESIRDFSRQGRADRYDFRTVSQSDLDRISSQARNEVRDMTSQRISFEGHRGPRGGDIGDLRNRIANDNNASDPSGRNGRQLTDRGGNDGETSLRLPETNSLRDRLVRLQGDDGDSSSFRGRNGFNPNRSDAGPGASDRGLTQRNAAAGDNGSESQQETLRERIEATRASRGNSDSNSIGRNFGRDNNRSATSESGQTDPSAADSALRDRINAARQAQSRGNSPLGQNGNENPNNDPSTTSQGRSGRPSTEPGDFRSRIEAARQAAEQNANGNSQPSPADVRRNRSAPSAPEPTPSGRSSTQPSDLRSRIESNRQGQQAIPNVQPTPTPTPTRPNVSPADARRNRSSSSAPDPIPSGRSSTQPSDLRSRIESSRQTPSSANVPQRSVPTPSSSPSIQNRFNPSRNNSPSTSPPVIRERSTPSTRSPSPGPSRSAPSFSPPSRSPSPSPSPAQSRRSRSTSSIESFGGSLRNSSIERSTSPPSIQTPSPTSSSRPSSPPSSSRSFPGISSSRGAPSSRSSAPPPSSRSSSGSSRGPSINRSPAPSSGSSSARSSGSSGSSSSRSRSPAQSRRNRD